MARKVLTRQKTVVPKGKDIGRVATIPTKKKGA